MNIYEKLAKALEENFNSTTYADTVRVTVWEKGDTKRIYLNGVGYNTKKVKQSVYFYFENGEEAATIAEAKVSVFTSSNQPMKWNIAQTKELKDRMQALIASFA